MSGISQILASFKPAVTGSLLMDTYPADVAFSLQRIKTGASNAVKVRRLSDSTTQNIGFSGNLFDNGSLNTFCSATNGFIDTWYNQGTNGLDIAQSTLLAQPKISTAGVTETDGSDYAPLFDRAASQVLTSGIISANTVFTMFAVVKLTTAANNNVLFLNGVANGYGLYTAGGGWKYFSRAVGESGGGTYNTSTVLITVCWKSASDVTVRLNGVSVYAGAAHATITPTTTFRLGGGDFGDFFGGRILEFICYSTDQSANYSAIESDINGRYVNI